MQSQFSIPRSSPFPNHQQHPDLNICFSPSKKSSNIVILCVRRQHRSVKVFDENWNNALLHQEQPTQLSLSHFTIPQQKLSCSSFQHCIYCCDHPAGSSTNALKILHATCQNPFRPDQQCKIHLCSSAKLENLSWTVPPLEPPSNASIYLNHLPSVCTVPLQLHYTVCTPPLSQFPHMSRDPFQPTTLEKKDWLGQ